MSGLKLGKSLSLTRILVKVVKFKENSKKLGRKGFEQKK